MLISVFKQWQKRLHQDGRGTWQGYLAYHFSTDCKCIFSYLIITNYYKIIESSWRSDGSIEMVVKITTFKST